MITQIAAISAYKIRDQSSMQRQDQCHGIAMMSQFANVPIPQSFRTIAMIDQISVIPIFIPLPPGGCFG